MKKNVDQMKLQLAELKTDIKGMQNHRQGCHDCHDVQAKVTAQSKAHKKQLAGNRVEDHGATCPKQCVATIAGSEAKCVMPRSTWLNAGHARGRRHSPHLKVHAQAAIDDLQTKFDTTKRKYEELETSRKEDKSTAVRRGKQV